MIRKNFFLYVMIINIWPIGIAMATIDKKLKVYRTRRDLERSPEPYGGKRKHAKKLKFVVQKHDASHLHYDFRLEIDGVLVSWAVPKGPSMDPKVKRLAMQTDDHPMEYGKFEGIIPEGSYGAGTVIVWDTGTFENIREKNEKLVPLDSCLKQGHIDVWLLGKKLKGGFSLIRFGGIDNKKQWLLVKKNDEYAKSGHAWKRTSEKSVLSGKTLRQMEQGEPDVWD